MDAASRKEKGDERMWLEDKEKGKSRRKRTNILLKTYKKRKQERKTVYGTDVEMGEVAEKGGRGDVPRTEEAKE